MKIMHRTFAVMFIITVLAAASAVSFASVPEYIGLQDIVSGKRIDLPLPAYSTTEGEIMVRRDEITGALRFLSVEDGRVIPVEGAEYQSIPAASMDTLLAEAEKNAALFLDQFKPLLCDDPENAIDFTVKRKRYLNGRYQVRFTQNYKGVPVYGAEVIVQLLRGKGVVALTSDIMNPGDRLQKRADLVAPDLLPQQVVDVSKDKVFQEYKIEKQELVSSRPELVLFAPEVIGDSGETRLCWKHRLARVNDTPSEEFLIDAHGGEVVMQLPTKKGAKYRAVYDGGGSRLPIPWDHNFQYQYNKRNYQSTGAIRRWEEEIYTEGDFGWPKPINEPVANIIYRQAPHYLNRTYDYLGQTYDFFLQELGRDSWVNDPSHPYGTHDIITTTYSLLNGFFEPGTEISATVNTNLTSFSNYLAFDNNGMTTDIAFFDPLGYANTGLMGWVPFPHVYYTADAAVADDIVAHEYGHAVNYYEVNFLPYKQSGALDEAYCDLWGEWVDLYNTTRYAYTGSDGPGFRWLIGEDIGRGYTAGQGGTWYDGSLDAAIRNLSNPKSMDQPARYGDENYVFGPDDNGGVHTNCTVIGRLGYLLTDGSIMIDGLGLVNSSAGANDSAPALFYRALTHYLVLSSDFNDLYYALMAAGADLGMDLDNIQRACELVNIAPGSLTAQYDISYYDRFNPTLQPTIANGNITISDPTARGTLVIRKKAGKEPYADIRSIVIAGSLQTLYSEANIGRLVVDGDVGRYLGADSYTRSIEVGGQIRAIRMDGRENSYSLDERLFATSNNSDPTTGMAAYRSYLDYSNPHIAVSINSNLNGEPARKFPLSIQAKGLGLTNIYAPYQPLRHFSLSAKLWDTGRGYQDISNSALFSTSTAQQFATYPAVAPFGQVNVANMKTMLAYGSQMNPEFITANRIPARRSRLVSRGMMFTPDYFGEAGHVFQFSEFTPDFVYMNSVNTSFHASAGDISPYRLFVTGQISNLSARMQFYRKYYYVPSGSQNGVPYYRLTSATHAYGGAVGDIPDFKGGSLDYNIYAAGMNNMYPAHIRNIVGTEYVSGIFICGVDYVTNDGTVVPDSRGRILRIGTNNDRLESAQFSIQFTDDPEIGGSVLGRAYVAGPIRRIVGDDTYFQVFDY